MKKVIGSLRIAVVSVAVVLTWATFRAEGQGRVYRAPRTADGKASLDGVWQVLSEANWDLVDHGPYAGLTQAGALGAAPPGLGAVEGNEIPYQPWALKKKQENFAKRWTDDPEVKCFLPGVPRATYLPYPFQILQSTNN